MQRRTTRLATLAIAILGAIAAWLVATRVFPYHTLNHDEGVYLQQAAMLLDGQLFLHPPVEDVMRPWFFVDDGDRLYGKYGPTPPAIFALGGVLGTWRLALVGVAAAFLALLAAVVREIAEPPAGVLAAAFALASPLFLVQAGTFLPYLPTATLNLAFAYGYLRADRNDDRRWAAIAGAAIGLSFLGRPYTALLFATPFIVHALWTLHRDWRAALPRQAATAGLGLAGVVVALVYNATLTGDPLLFPFYAFAPHDGLGFGTRHIVGQDIPYPPEIALRANARVLALYLKDWLMGGPLGALLAAAGLGVVARRGPSSRTIAVAGLFVTVPAGNIAYWGNLNILADLSEPGDGIVTLLGPYYHFDLLVPTAAFAAVGVVHLGRWLDDACHGPFDGQRARAATAAVAAVALVGVGAVTLVVGAAAFDENLDATATYERVYEPFDDGPPRDSAILLPDPLGDWLNHPFQPLRNDPDFDGRAVYAIDDRPFAVADAYPDRDLYRYGYRGRWNPKNGSPMAATLRPTHHVVGDRVRLEASFGVPEDTRDVAVEIGADAEEIYRVTEIGETVELGINVAEDRVELTGPVERVGFERIGNDTVPVGTDTDVVTLVVDVDRERAGRITYRLEIPVAIGAGRVRALTPRVAWCRLDQRCDRSATYLPSVAPDGISVTTELHVPDGDARGGSP